jgi:hypothetical protein
MEAKSLGPNGGMVYAVNYMEKNIEGIIENIIKAAEGEEGEDKGNEGPVYYLFDCPGQVELFTHSTSVKNIIQELTKPLHKGEEKGKMRR